MKKTTIVKKDVKKVVKSVAKQAPINKYSDKELARVTSMVKEVLQADKKVTGLVLVSQDIGENTQVLGGMRGMSKANALETCIRAIGLTNQDAMEILLILAMSVSAKEKATKKSKTKKSK